MKKSFAMTSATTLTTVMGACLIAACLMIMNLALPDTARAEMTGKEIMQEQKKRHDVDLEYTESIMLLVDKKGNKEKRLVKEYSKQLSEGEDRSLMVFTDPASIRGTALLTWDHENAASDQWLYLPAQKKMQRIAQSSKKSYFMGTDFTYEDMEPEDIENFEYVIVGNETMDDKDCWVIEATPANEIKKRESAYSKRKLWVTKDTFVTVQVEFYDRRDKLQKVQTGRDFVNLRGDVWRAQKTQMDNVKQDHKTLLGVTKRVVDEDIPDSVFTERHVLSGKHLQ